MREITTHRVTSDDPVRIETADDPGPGGAHHKYDLYLLHKEAGHAGKCCSIPFQKGPVGGANPPNGVTNESLLAVVIDRLRGFQAGPYSCRENALALTHVETALLWLQQRTRDRLARGVEGKMEK